MAGTGGAARADAERLFDRALQRGAVPAGGLLALLGMVGLFGKSSDETEWVSYAVGAGGYSRKLAVPAPAAWCDARRGLARVPSQRKRSGKRAPLALNMACCMAY